MKKVLNTLLTMSRPLGTLLLLLTLLCVASWNSPATAQTSTTPKLYAVLEDNGTTLKFKWDTNMPEVGGVSCSGDRLRDSVMEHPGHPGQSDEGCI